MNENYLCEGCDGVPYVECLRDNEMALAPITTLQLLVQPNAYARRAGQVHRRLRVQPRVAQLQRTFGTIQRFRVRLYAPRG